VTICSSPQHYLEVGPAVGAAEGAAVGGLVGAEEGAAVGLVGRHVGRDWFWLHAAFRAFIALWAFVA